MTLKNIVLLVLGLFCSYKAVACFYTAPNSAGSMVAGYAAAMATVIIALIWATFAGLCFASVAVPRFSSWFSGFLYLPIEYLKSPPEKIAPIKGLIEQENYEEAIERLNQILARKPFETAAVLLLAEIYFEHLAAGERGAELVLGYFGRQKLPAAPENIELLMRYCDYASQQGVYDTAVRLLEQETARRGYTIPEQKTLQLRMEAIKAKQ